MHCGGGRVLLSPLTLAEHAMCEDGLLLGKAETSILAVLGRNFPNKLSCRVHFLSLLSTNSKRTFLESMGL